MIIPLHVGNIAGCKRAYLTMTLRAPQCRLPIKGMTAIIDTGSPYYLILSYREALRSHFPFTKSKPKEIVPIGGGKIEVHPVKNAIIYTKDLENKLIMLKPQAVYFSTPTSKRQDRKIETYSMPNLLGVEFLEVNRFKFVFDPANDKAYLEKED